MVNIIIPIIPLIPSAIRDLIVLLLDRIINSNKMNILIQKTTIFNDNVICFILF